ncbi:hypothetical protein EYC84_002657 [Monilinia fructicola]|uniref:Uncharacterized protein n=1 Tax=Monilinia fructicola TaxID=38448 RepID=A0A5M9JM82_MONFR|nr:hypothetical protein EYC84_002657 [Monilinia fructicola]
MIEAATNSDTGSLQVTTRKPVNMAGQQVQKKRNLAREKRFTTYNDIALIRAQQKKKAQRMKREEKKKKKESMAREEREENRRREIEEELEQEEEEEEEEKLEEEEELKKEEGIKKEEELGEEEELKMEGESKLEEMENAKDENGDGEKKANKKRRKNVKKHKKSKKYKKSKKPQKKQIKAKEETVCPCIKNPSPIAFIVTICILILQNATQWLAAKGRPEAAFIDSTVFVVAGMCADVKKFCQAVVASIPYMYAHRADIWLITKDIFLISLAISFGMCILRAVKNLSAVMQLVLAACVAGVGLLVPYKGPVFSLVVALVVLLVGAVFALVLRMRGDHLRLEMKKKVDNRVARRRSARMQARGTGAVENSELDSWTKKTWELLL